MEHDVILKLIGVLVLGVGSQWLAWRFRIPAIVLLASAGVVVGPMLGWLVPSRDFGELIHPVIEVAVAVVLFEGGMNLKRHELNEAAAGVKRLVTAGLVLSFVLGALAAHYVGGLSWAVAGVFGAMMVVTGPTVILPLLRQAHMQQRPASYLKWEGIINDPLGAMLAVLVFEYVVSYGEPFSAFLGRFGLALVGGGILGWAAGYGLVQAFRRGTIPEFLKGPSILCAVLIVYVGANVLQAEAGLLAVTVLGSTIGNQGLSSINEIRRLKEYITLLLVSSVFVLLTADLEPELLAQLDWRGAALVAVMLLVVRPVAVWLATIGSDMRWQERLLVGWVAPRGVVAAAMAGIFAPSLVAHGYLDGALLLPLVFGMIFATVIAHGFTAGWLAQRLGLADDSASRVLIVGASPWSTELARTLMDLDVPVLLVDSAWNRLQEARLAGVPVYAGEVLSEETEERLHLADLAYVLAATDNDAYNALVCTHFAPELGRSRVYQLPLHQGSSNEAVTVQRTLLGRVVFNEAAVYESLLERHYQGWGFNKTRLSDEYGFTDYLKDHPDALGPLLVVRADGDVRFHSERDPVIPEAGDVVVGYAPAHNVASSPLAPAAAGRLP